MFPKQVVAAAIALSPFLLATEALASKVLLRCTGSTTCYYTFFLGTSVKNWTLQGGATYANNGVQPGDQYCQRSDGKPNDPNTCKRFTLTKDMLHD
jgi:hypothetical protein